MPPGGHLVVLWIVTNMNYASTELGQFSQSGSNWNVLFWETPFHGNVSRGSQLSVWSLSPINRTVWLHLGLKVARCVLDHAGCCSLMPLLQMFLSPWCNCLEFSRCCYLRPWTIMKIFTVNASCPATKMDRYWQIMCSWIKHKPQNLMAVAWIWETVSLWGRSPI